jgi:2-keto-3-deoxy-L-rhamnonate aldolase RhmA
MRNSRTLKKLRAGRPVRICSLGCFNPAFVAQAAHFGYDCIWLDLEHRTMDARETQALLAFFHRFDIDCLLRAPTLEKTGLYRYLEDGAAGLMIPHVSTVEQAESLVRAVRFPPVGDRGQDGAGLDVSFLPGVGTEDYTEQANAETFLVVQIETPQAVENVDAIAAVNGLDGLFVGPGDLGLRIRSDPTIEWTLEQAIDRVSQAAASHGKAWGLPVGSEQEICQYRDMGAQLLAYGGDFRAIMMMLEQWSQDLDRVQY